MPRIAMVISTVGYHWEELFAAYDVFEQAGVGLELYTVDGSPPKPDPLSVKKSPLFMVGLGVSAAIAPDTDKGIALRGRLLEVAPLSALDPSRVDAIYLPGGHGCLFDINTNATLHRKIADLFSRGAILSGVCHATSTFSYVTVNGQPITRGHALTGFPNPLDQTLIRLGLVHPEFLPLPLINDDELRRGGAKLSKRDVLGATLNPRTTRISLPFITGVGPKAAAPVAQAVLEALNEERPRVTNGAAPHNKQPEVPRVS